MTAETTAPTDAFTAAYMDACKDRAADHNELGLHYFRAGAELSRREVNGLLAERAGLESSCQHLGALVDELRSEQAQALGPATSTGAEHVAEMLWDRFSTNQIQKWEDEPEKDSWRSIARGALLQCAAPAGKNAAAHAAVPVAVQPPARVGLAGEGQPGAMAFDDEDITCMSLVIGSLERIASGETETSDDRLFAKTKPRKMTIVDAKAIAAGHLPVMRRLRANMDAAPGAVIGAREQEGDSLHKAVENFLFAYRAKYKRDGGRIRANAPLIDEVKLLNAAFASPVAAPTAQPNAAPGDRQGTAEVLCPNGERWDGNPDGIQPGQERGPRMNQGTGFWENGEADEESVTAAEAIAAGHTPGDSVPGVSTRELVRAMDRRAAPGAVIAAREQTPRAQVEQEAPQVVTYHRDDEGQGAIEAYAAIAACLDDKNLKAVANWVAHGARATLGPGRVSLTRRDWDSIKFFPIASPKAAPADPEADWKLKAIKDATPYCLACEVEGHRTHECHSTHGFNSPRDMEMSRLSWIAAGYIAPAPAADQPQGGKT